MKKIKLIFGIFLFFNFAFSQAPQGINYQAVIRNSNGAAVVNTNLWLRVQLIQGNVNGSIAYAEEFQVNSSSTGLVNIVIGNGTPLGATVFSDIDWSNSPYFFEIAYHTTNNPTYTTMGTQQFVSVPYALYAETANSIANDQVNDADADPTNELQDISLSGTDLSITNGSTISLSSLQDGTGTDDQILILSGTILQIENGNAVDLSSLQDSLTGPAGADGQDGQDGLSAYDIWLAQGNTGTEADFLNGLTGPQGPAGTNGVDGIDGTNGMDGQDGLSAYDIWLAQGNTGTEADFLNGLTGSQGPAGPQGIPGVGVPQTISQSGNIATLSDGGGTINLNDADSDPTNELQALSLSNDTLYLSNGNAVFLGELSSNNNSAPPGWGNSQVGPYSIVGANSGCMTLGANSTSENFMFSEKDSSGGFFIQYQQTVNSLYNVHIVHIDSIGKITDRYNVGNSTASGQGGINYSSENNSIISMGAYTQSSSSIPFLHKFSIDNLNNFHKTYSFPYGQYAYDNCRPICLPIGNYAFQAAVKAQSNSNNYDRIALVVIDSIGNVVDRKIFGLGTSKMEPKSLMISEDGYIYSLFEQNNNTQLVLAKLDLNLNFIWTKIIFNGDIGAAEIKPGNNGNIITSFQTTPTNVLYSVTSSAGNFLYFKEILVGNISIHSLSTFPEDGRICVSGTYNIGGYAVFFNEDGSNLTAIKTENDLNFGQLRASLLFDSSSILFGNYENNLSGSDYYDVRIIKLDNSFNSCCTESANATLTDVSVSYTNSGPYLTNNNLLITIDDQYTPGAKANVHNTSFCYD